jgi:Holliday junction resolvase-like predicted endonuclease
MDLFMPKKSLHVAETTVLLTEEQKRRLWRKILGDIGEQIVSQFLTSNGWQIVCRKFRVGRSPEVDIIAISPEKVTIFIEVKTRTIWSDCASTWFESATQSIDARKQKRIISASRRYRIANQDCQLANCRYDIFLVGLSYKLARNLVDLKSDEGVDNFALSDVIDFQIAEHVSGRGSSDLQFIHYESAFVTNF